MFADMNSQLFISFQYMSPIHASIVQAEWGPGNGMK